MPSQEKTRFFDVSHQGLKISLFLPMLNQNVLFNLKTDKLASRTTEMYLLKELQRISNRDKLSEECQKSGYDRFDKPTKKLNFKFCS